MNLYQRAKRGLLDSQPVQSQVRVFVTPTGWPTFHIQDADGREVAMHRTDAVVVMLALKTALALKANK